MEPNKKWNYIWLIALYKYVVHHIFVQGNVRKQLGDMYIPSLIDTSPKSSNNNGPFLSITIVTSSCEQSAVLNNASTNRSVLKKS